MLFCSASSSGGFEIFTTTQITNFHYLFMGIHKKNYIFSLLCFFLSHKFHFMFLSFFFLAVLFFVSKAYREVHNERRNIVCRATYISTVWSHLNKKEARAKILRHLSFSCFFSLCLIYVCYLMVFFGANISNRKFVSKIPEKIIFPSLRTNRWLTFNKRNKWISFGWNFTQLTCAVPSGTFHTRERIRDGNNLRHDFYLLQKLNAAKITSHLRRYVRANTSYIVNNENIEKWSQLWCKFGKN